MIAPFRPVHDARSHQAALEEIERLWGAASSSPEGQHLDLLMTLVDAYERAQWEDDALDPIDAIKARMENSGRTRKDLEKIVGSSGRVSEILTRKRRLTLPMIWLLVEDGKCRRACWCGPISWRRKGREKTRAARSLGQQPRSVAEAESGGSTGITYYPNAKRAQLQGYYDTFLISAAAIKLTCPLSSPRIRSRKPFAK